MRYNVRARTLQELQALASPASQGQLEAVNWKYFDTQTITSGTTTVLNFFGTIQQDKTLGNIEQAGTIQAPNWLEVYCIKCDFLSGVTDSATATAGLMNDVAQVLWVQRATYQLTMNSKSYGIVPLSFAHGSGGPVGVIQGTAAANHLQQYANNSIPDDGDWLGGVWLNPFTNELEEAGQITMPPNQSFSLQVAMAAAPTLTANLNVRLSMCGVLHRQVR